MATTTSARPALPVTELEAFEELRARALGKLGRTPVDLIVRHLLAVYRDGDWPLQRAALEAVIRRQAFARRDDLVVTTRPRGRLGLVEPLPPDILPVADEPDDETELEVVLELLAAPAPTLVDAEPEPPPPRAPRREAASKFSRHPTPARSPGGAQVQQLLGSVRVERTADGGLRLEAPPEAAETLAAMFQAMATLLGSAADRS